MPQGKITSSPVDHQHSKLTSLLCLCSSQAKVECVGFDAVSKKNVSRRSVDRPLFPHPRKWLTTPFASFLIATCTSSSKRSFSSGANSPSGTAEEAQSRPAESERRRRRRPSITTTRPQTDTTGTRMTINTCRTDSRTRPHRATRPRTATSTLAADPSPSRTCQTCIRTVPCPGSTQRCRTITRWVHPSSTTSRTE